MNNKSVTAFLVFRACDVCWRLVGWDSGGGGANGAEGGKTGGLAGGGGGNSGEGGEGGIGGKGVPTRTNDSCND